MSERSRQLKLGAVLSYVGIFIGIITGLTYHPWMIRTIGNSDYGLYTLAMSLINTFMIDFGLSLAAQRFISKYLAEKNQQAVNDVVGLIFKLYLIISAVLLVFFCVLYFFIGDIYTQLTITELGKFKVLYIMAAIYSVTAFPFLVLNGILNSYEKFISLKLCVLIHKIVTVSLTAIALVMGYGVYVLVVVNLIASVIHVALRLYSIRRYTNVKPNFSYRNKSKVKELFGFSIWTSISTIAMRLLLTLAPSILGVVSGTLEIAVFGYAVSIEGHIYTFVNAINGFFMPRLSVLSAQEDEQQGREKVLELMTGVGRLILMLYGLIFVGFAVLGKDFVTLLVGKQYVKSYYCVLLICGYGIIAYPQQIANTYTIVKNKVKIRAMASIVSIAFYLVFAFAFSKIWGSVGASVAVCLALILQTILMNIIYYRILKIDVFRFFKGCHLKLLPGFLVFGFVSYVITRFPFYGWFGFICKVFLMLMTFGVISWFMLLNKREKHMLFKLR